jgi:5-methylcytosine-specific restriction enzyme B
VDLPGGGKDVAPLQLKIPTELYIIGTMNLIDQSIEQIDFALRRRFLWVLCPFDRAALLGICQNSVEAN